MKPVLASTVMDQIPCTCNLNEHCTDQVHVSKCSRTIAADHPKALFYRYDAYSAVLWPGTTCEWPIDGPGSGRGPGGSFACKHCGLGHNDHGDGNADIARAFDVPKGKQHRICKIFLRYPQPTLTADQLESLDLIKLEVSRDARNEAPVFVVLSIRTDASLHEVHQMVRTALDRHEGFTYRIHSVGDGAL